MLTTCFHCNAEHPEGHYERVVHNKTALYGPWTGWRMAGRFLVAPDRDRITPERLRGLLWHETLRPKRSVGSGGIRRPDTARDRMVFTGYDNIRTG